VLLMTVDDEVRQGVGRATTQSLNNDLWDVPTRYVTGLFTNDDLRVTGRHMLESLTFSGITAVIIRYVSARSPHAHEGPWKFNGFRWNNEMQAFPSGHPRSRLHFQLFLRSGWNNCLG
jgi:hypothetical protein